MENAKACILLLVVAMLWGSGFAVTKNALNTLEPIRVLFLRFALAALIMLPFLWKRLRTASAQTWKAGVLIGAAIAFGHIFQIYGLRDTTAGKNAFLSAVYVVLVPFMVWAAGRRKPTGWNLAAAFLCLGGVAMLTLGDTWSIGWGELLALCGGVCFAVQITLIEIYAQECDMLVMTWITMLVSAAIAGMGDILSGAAWVPPGAAMLLSIAYLAIFCSVLALGGQNLGIKYANPALATILLSMEAVFGCLTGIIFLGETVSLRMLIGFFLIGGSLCISNLHKRNIKLDSL